MNIAVEIICKLVSCAIVLGSVLELQTGLVLVLVLVLEGLVLVLVLGLECMVFGLVQVLDLE